MSSNQQAEWRLVRLGEIFTERKEKGREGLPVASVSIERGLVLRSSLDRRVVSDLPPEGHALVRAGDIAYNMMRMWQGACGLAQADCIISPAYVVMTPTERIDPQFAHIALRSQPVIKLLHGYSQGIVDDRLRLYSDAFAQVPINLPPIDEQRRIAEVLRSVDNAISANRAALDQVGRARSAILHTAFEEALWEVVPLGELGSWQSGGTPSKADKNKWGGDVPWVCPRDMKTPVIRRTHSTISPLALGGSCKLAPRGTLMIVVRGMILAKAIPTATIAMEATFNQDIKAFRPNGRALPKFVQLCLQHQEHQLLRMVNTATHGTKKLDTDILLSVPVPLPDLETQQSLADAVADLDFASVKYGEEHIRLSTIKQALLSDLLSGRVRVPAHAKGSTMSVAPAFKRAVFAAEIVQQLHNDNRFGSVKHEKIVHLCELHLDLHDDLDRHAYKKAAGPYDPGARRSVEQIFRQQKWFGTAKPDGKRVVYSPLEKAGGHKVYYDRYFGEQSVAIQSMIDLLRPLDTERCEIVATLYAVWNDFLIDGHEPSDDEIVISVLNDWHPSKRQIAESRWRLALPWMRQRNLVPKGHGEKTRTASG